MKRLLMYLVVAVVLISVGFSVYYVVRDDEEIYSLVDDNQIFYINQGETLDLPVVWEDPASTSEFKITSSGYESYVSINLEDWTITGENAGLFELTFATTNDKFAGQTFSVNCYVGNGSTNFPFYVRDEQDLRKIGHDNWSLSANYQLVNDITLTQPFTPIGLIENDGVWSASEFNGSFSGGAMRHKISNVKIEDFPYPTVGFFVKVGEFGRVENVVFDNVYIKGTHTYAGVVAGANYGLIGMCEIENSTVINDYQNGFTGGICGLNERKAGSDNFAQLNMCSSNVNITSKWVAGGAVGYNYGGVVFNCLITTNNLDIKVANEGQEDYQESQSLYSYFGGIAGISVCAVEDEMYYDSYISNNIAYINQIASTHSGIGGIFGAYYGVSGVYQSQGNYNMLFYIAPYDMDAYYLYDDEQLLTDDPSSSRNYTKQISQQQALVKTTFTSIPGNGWDFDNVWEIEDGIAIRIGYNRLDGEEPKYQAFASNGSTYEISTTEQLKNAFEQMRAQPTKNITYHITKSLVYNGGGELWQPIGGHSNPFQGQFVMDEDVTLTIRNISINAEFAGIFGCINGNNTVIRNFIVENAYICGTVAGVIAGANYGATIENCQVSDFELTTQKYAGGIAGYNSGTISNCLLSARIATDESDMPIEDEYGNYTYEQKGAGGYITLANNSQRVIYLGGIAGKNAGTITDTRADKTDIRFIEDDSSKVIFIGGAAGESANTINAVNVRQLTIAVQDYSGSAYAGGIVGYLSAGKVSSCIFHEINNIIFDVNNQNIVAGGLAGYTSEGSKMQYSVVGTTSIYAYAIGGFAGVANGAIQQSYVSNSTALYGKYVGGFTSSLSGEISNCMTAAELVGSEIEAGMTVYLRKNALINYCYINPTFQIQTGAEGGIISSMLGSLINRTTYAETSSQFRARPDMFGKITNTYIVGEFKTVGLPGTTIFTDNKVTINGVEAAVQTTFATWALDVKTTSLQGVTGVATILKNAGFNDGIWNFANNDSGVYTLPIKAAEVGVVFEKQQTPEPEAPDVTPENPDDANPENPDDANPEDPDATPENPDATPENPDTEIVQPTNPSGEDDATQNSGVAA